MPTRIQMGDRVFFRRGSKTTYADVVSVKGRTVTAIIGPGDKESGGALRFDNRSGFQVAYKGPVLCQPMICALTEKRLALLEKAGRFGKKKEEEESQERRIEILPEPGFGTQEERFNFYCNPALPEERGGDGTP